MAAFDKELFLANLSAHTIGHPLIVADTMDSTNRFLLNKASEKTQEGILVIAETQTAGRGRHQRVWHSPPGINLYFSFLLWPDTSPLRRPQLAFITALALRRAIVEQDADIDIGLKWPNDLWLNGRKLSGILCECPSETMDGRPGIVVGIGLNINSQLRDFPEELQNTATSLRIHTGKTFSRERLLAGFCNAFQELYDKWLTAENLTPFMGEWSQHDILLDKTITIQDNSDSRTGIVTGYTPEGFLRLRTPDRELIISAGDAHIGHSSVPKS